MSKQNLSRSTSLKNNMGENDLEILNYLAKVNEQTDFRNQQMPNQLNQVD